MEIFKNINAKKLLNLCIFFVCAILIFGTMGIWLPPLLHIGIGNEAKTIDWYDVYQNATTYFLSVAAASCFVLTASIIKSGIANKIGAVFGVLMLFIFFMALLTVNCFLIIHEVNYWAKFIVIIGNIGAMLLWWISNWKSSDMDPMDAIQ